MEIIDLDVNDLIKRYLAGETVQRLAKAFKVSRRTVNRRLELAGVAVRGHTEARLLSWTKMTRKQRAAQVKAAHAAVRGATVPIERKIKHARTVEAKRLHTSPDEIALQAMLSRRGIKTINQQAIGPYNCDLGALPVAVEVFGGGWHWHGRHLLRTAERFRYIMDAGWHLLIIKASAERHPITEATADYVAAFIKQMRRKKTAVRQYRVIRGAGELLAGGCADDDDISIIPALRSGRDTNGRYKGVPR